ncbi:MAG: T9SS type A sorting domain-containing protein [Bacteroidetes bacterium]|nr:T9SS C-terminal target domain-containing protein [Bacteroidota bacterium]NOG95174.1 T9SS type A sorting domain-containing protein [Bacteroidota bacterium]
MKHLPPPIFGALKTAVLTVFINVTSMLNAQNNNTCQTAGTVSVDSICSFTTQYFEPGQTEKWAVFNSFSNQTIITMAANNNLSVAYIDSFTVYTGNCTNLQFIQTFYPSQLDVDSSFTASISNLSPGQTYYIALYKTIGMGDEAIDICTTYPSLIPGNPPCPAPGICENVLANGGFDYAFVYTYFFGDPFSTWTNNGIPTPGSICYWETAWGSPQVHLALPSTPPRYAAMWANDYEGEAISAPLNILINIPYWLSYKARAYVNGGQPISMANLTFMLTDANQTLLPFGGSTIPTFIPGGSQVISTTGLLPYTTNWTIYGACFTPNDPNWNQLIIFPQNNWNAQTWTNVDDISITRLDDAGPNVNLVCDVPVQIGPPCVIAGATYSWSPATGLSNANVPNPIASPTQTTTYTLTITTPDGACTVSSTVTVTVIPSLTVQLDGPYTICEGQSVTIQAPLVTGGTPSYNYSWNTIPPQFTSSITVSPTVTTTYTVTVTDAYGCIGTASVTVYVNPLPPAPIITGPNPSCDTSFTWCISNFNPNFTYTWSAPNALSVAPTPNGQCADIIWNNAGGWISVILTDLNGCTNTGSFYVNECCVKESPEPGMTINLINQTASWLIANYPGFFSTFTPPTFDQSSAYLNINGTFTIDVPYFKFVQIPNIYLSENAEIIIGSGNHLELRLDTLQACSDKMWERIFIPNASSKLTAYNCLFMDAQHTVWSDNGGEMFLKGNTFKLNRICVQVEPYNQPIISTIENNQFIGNAPLKQPFSGLRTNIGINLNKVYNTNAIGGFIIGLNNTFSNMNIGINSIESIVHVFGNSFSNIQNTLSEAAIAAINITGRTQLLFTLLPYAEIGGQGNKVNTFSNCKNGITARAATNMKISYNTFNSITTSGIYYQFFSNLVFTSNVNIFKNTFQNNGTAIYSYRNFLCKSYIYSNTIQSNLNTGGIGIRAEELGGSPNPNRTQIFANTIKGVTRGVWLTGMEETKIDNNTIQVKKIGFLLARGIEASNCLKTEISSNNIQCTPPTNASNAGGIYASLSPASNICGNDIKNLGYAIQCNGPMISRVVSNKFTNLPTGIWLNNGGIIGQQGAPGQPSNNRWMSNFTNHTLVTLGTPPASEIYHRSSPSYFIPVFNNGGIPPIIATVTTGSQFGPICPAIAPPPNLLLQVAKDQLTYSGPENRWHSRHNLYRELSLDTVLLQSDTTFVNFTDTISYENTGLLDSVKTIATNPALNNNLNLLQSATLTNNTVSPLLNTEDRAKTVNSILLDMAFAGTTSLTPQQLSTLQGIAAECPYTEGTAVYDARVLIAPYDSTDYLNICETEYNFENNGRFMQQDEKRAINEKPIFEIYPNPTDDILYIKAHDSTETGLNVFIYDMTGRLLIEKTNKSGFFEVSVGHLPMGMYSVKIRTGNTVYNRKILINR